MTRAFVFLLLGLLLAAILIIGLKSWRKGRATPSGTEAPIASNTAKDDSKTKLIKDEDAYAVFIDLLIAARKGQPENLIYLANQLGDERMLRMPLEEPAVV